MLSPLHVGDVLLGDACYASYFLLCELQHRHIDGVFEQYGDRSAPLTSFRGNRWGGKDHLIELRKPERKSRWMRQEQYAPLIALAVRELYCGSKVLVTTLLSPRHSPKAESNKLYRSRWYIELDLHNLKSTLGVEVLICKTPDIATKELWVYLLAHNLIRLLMTQSALLGDCLRRQLSFKHTLQIWGAWPQYHDESDGEQITSLLFLIAEQRVGDRPGRIEPRTVKRRSKTQPLQTSQDRRLAGM